MWATSKARSWTAPASGGRSELDRRDRHWSLRNLCAFVGQPAPVHHLPRRIHHHTTPLVALIRRAVLCRGVRSWVRPRLRRAIRLSRPLIERPRRRAVIILLEMIDAASWGGTATDGVAVWHRRERHPACCRTALAGACAWTPSKRGPAQRARYRVQGTWNGGDELLGSLLDADQDGLLDLGPKFF